MIVCSCEGISDRLIRERIREGARTVQDVRKSCGAGSQCGSCTCDIKELLAEAGHGVPVRPLPVAAK